MSNQLNDDYLWVQRCIESCENKWQVETSLRMLDLFKAKHPTAKNEVDSLYDSLFIVHKVLRAQKIEV